MMKVVVASLVALSMAGVAHADCAGMMGTTIAPITFDAAAAAIGKIPATKGEFETTADFEARVAAAQSGLPSEIVISTPFDPEYAVYDADAGAFDIKVYAVRNINVTWFDVFYDTPFYNVIKFNSLGYNNDFVISTTDRTTGSHMGTNGFGASARISEISRTSRAIFEGESARDTNMWGQGRNAPVLTWHVPVAATEARAMKTAFKGAVVIAPKAPFYFEHDGVSRGSATIANPIEVTQNYKVIVADIQCVVVMDGANKVLVAQPTA